MVFYPHENEGSVFKFLRFEERFRKAPFSWRISVDGRPNRRNKAVFKFLRRSLDGASKEAASLGGIWEL